MTSPVCYLVGNVHGLGSGCRSLGSRKNVEKAEDHRAATTRGNIQQESIDVRKILSGLEIDDIRSSIEVGEMLR